MAPKPATSTQTHTGSWLPPSSAALLASAWPVAARGAGLARMRRLSSRTVGEGSPDPPGSASREGLEGVKENVVP